MSDPHARLEKAMEARRLELGMKTWRELAQAADISYETLRALRKGEGRPVAGTMSGLERALQWSTGSIAALLAATGVPTSITRQRNEDVDLEELMQDPEARAALRTIIRRIRGEPPEPDSPGRDEEAG